MTEITENWSHEIRGGASDFRLRLLAWTTVALLAGLAPPLAAQPADGAALSADEIVDRSLETNTMGFQRGEVQLTMIIQNARGEQRERRLHIRSLKEEGLNRALVRILAPPEVAGQSYLFMENDGRDDDVWIYLPALDDEPRRISGSQKSDAFMGSNITYSDLESRDIREASYTRLPDEELAGFPVYVIDATSEDSAYASIRMWIRMDDYIPLRVRFFAQDGSAAKTLFTEDVNTSQGRTYVRRMSVVDAEDMSTTVIIEAIDFEADISSAEFTRENLAR